MKKFFLFSFFIFSFSFTKAQWVTIPDANFRNWLNANGYSSCMSGNQMDTTCSLITNEDTLYIVSGGISNITGVQYFDNVKVLITGCSQLHIIGKFPPHLIRLDCGTGQLDTLPALPYTIKFLNCNENNLISLPPLPDSLQYLWCVDNLISSLPDLPLNLHSLLCGMNQLTSLPLLPSGLSTISCGANLLTTLPSLPTSLSFLECGGNYLTALSLSTLPLLNELYCSHNLIDSLPNCPFASIVNCSYNLLTTLPQFSENCADLDCSNNQLISLPDLPSSMNSLRINSNPNLNCLPPIENINSSSEANLNISGTGITCLPNIIHHYGGVWPSIDFLPLCGIFNPSGCEVAWNIKGNVARDIDGLCNSTNDGSPILNIKMELNDSLGNVIQQVFTIADGNYSFDTQLGNYIVNIDTTDLPFNVLCPFSNSDSSVITSNDSLDYNADFRLMCEPGFDIGVWSIYRYHRLFPNEISYVHVLTGDIVQSIYNVTCSSGISGAVKVVINGPANYVSPLAGALTPIVNGDTLTYSIADFSLVNATTDFAFNMLTDSTAQIGDAICFDVSVTPTAGDNNISNNTLTHCFAVSNSFDPNEKEVSPIGDLNFPFNNWLTYTIHFQNTGTAAAQHIQILDSLDTDLDESTFQLLSSSFDPMVQLFGNKVHFNFVNINLPDSATDAEGSKGYVSYRIKPKQNLAIGTQIENTASIYFDFNSPVVTNTTLNTIVHDDFAPTVLNDFQFSVYPNPFSSQLTVNMLRQAQHDSYTISVTDILGRNVIASVITKQSQITIDVQSLSSGIYFLKVLLEDGNFAVKKIVKE